MSSAAPLKSPAALDAMHLVAQVLARRAAALTEARRRLGLQWPERHGMEECYLAHVVFGVSVAAIAEAEQADVKGIRYRLERVEESREHGPYDDLLANADMVSRRIAARRGWAVSPLMAADLAADPLLADARRAPKSIRRPDMIRIARRS